MTREPQTLAEARLTDAEERLLRALLPKDESFPDEVPRVWLRKLMASLDSERQEVERLERRLQRCEEAPYG